MCHKIEDKYEKEGNFNPFPLLLKWWVTLVFVGLGSLRVAMGPIEKYFNRMRHAPCQSNFSTMSAKLFLRDFLSFFKAFNLPIGVTGVTPYPKSRQIEK